MIRLGELLAIRDLQLSMCVYDPGRDPWLRWAYILNELVEVDQFQGGEFVLMDDRLRDTLPADRHLVSALVRGGAAALGVAPVEGGTVAQSLVTACERRHLPLLEISPPATCGEVAKRVITGIYDHCWDLGPAQLALHDQQFLTGILAAGGGIGPMLDRLHSEHGIRVWLLTEGAAFTPGGLQLPPRRDIRRVIDAATQQGSVEVSLTGGVRACVFPLEVPDSYSRHGAYLVTECPGGEFSAQVSRALERGLSFAEVGLTMMYGLRAARRSLEEEFMGRVEAGHVSSDELSVWTQALGTHARCRLTCVLVRGTQMSEPDFERVAHALRDLAESLRAAHVVVTKNQEVRAFIFGGQTDNSAVEDALRRAPLLRQAQLTRLGATVGTSSVIANSVSDFTQVLLDARQVCTFNSLRERGPEVLQQPDQSLGASLLASDERSRSALHDTVLAPLASYDRSHGTDIVRTLDVFLSTCGQWNASAATLGIHVNTLRYRIGRIEKLTGRSISSMSDRVDLYLALRTNAEK